MVSTLLPLTLKGKIAESGTHESLMSIYGGVDSGLVDSQAFCLGDSAQKDVENESDTDDLQTSTQEETRAESRSGGPLCERVESEMGNDHGFFGSFGRFFHESKTYGSIIGFSLFASAADETALPL